MSVAIHIGDCRDVLCGLPDASVHCVVTSPPYWGLRDYGVSGQIGLESDFRDYVATLVEVFREVRRVLRKDGTLWLNLGDSYTANGNLGKQAAAFNHLPKRSIAVGLKPKDLVGIPWRAAFALQEDGWYLRQDIIWSKPNPMPESVTDRCTKAHEYLFLLSKSERYYFDQDAIAEPNAEFDRPQSEKRREQRLSREVASVNGRGQSSKGIDDGLIAPSHVMRTSMTRNKRSVWEVTTQPFSEAHFATFPPALINPCIKAGCPQGGTVLDPFAGAGTTGLVADRLQRNAILIELNPQYGEMGERRIREDAPLFVDMREHADFLQ